jgi:hypothetical protein
MYPGRFDAGAHAPLDSDMQGKLGALQRLTFTVRRGGAIVGTTCIFYDQSAPKGVEIGATHWPRQKTIRKVDQQPVTFHARLTGQRLAQCRDLRP